MEIILYTKGVDLIVKTCYIADQECFATIFEYPNGEQVVVDTYKSVMYLAKSHDFWCKFSGVIEGQLNPVEVELRLSSAFSKRTASLKIA